MFRVGEFALAEAFTRKNPIPLIRVGFNTNIPIFFEIFRNLQDISKNSRYLEKNPEF